MPKYGWYTEGDEIIGGSGDDVADLIHDAVADFAAGEKEGTEEARSNIADFIRKLRVGEFRAFAVDELIDEEDIAEHELDYYMPMGQADLWELLYTRIADVVGFEVEVKSSAQFITPDESGKIQASAIMEWARKNITFDPPHYCDGRNPFPFCLVDGKWIFGEKETENADIKAYVVYTTQPSPETGDEGWVWWAQGRMGEAGTLQDAMSQAEAKLAQIAAKEAS